MRKLPSSAFDRIAARSAALLLAWAASGAQGQGAIVGYTVVIKADYAAQSAEAFERALTQPLERGLKNIDAVAQIRSETTQDSTTITVIFKSLDAPSCQAFRAITQAVLQAHRTFPVAVSVPVISFGEGKCKQID